MRFNRTLLIAAMALAATLPGCVPIPVPIPGPSTQPAQPMPGGVLQTFQRGVAQRIHQASAGQTYEGNPPVPLQAVIVVAAEIDAHGNVVRTRMLRSKPGYPELDQRATASIQRAAPFPKPPPELLRGRRTVEISESWLFDDAGRFQLRTLSPGQLLRTEDGRVI